MNELELRILKAIISNSVFGLEFSYKYGPELFLNELTSFFAKTIVDYMKSYRSLPTRRTISEWHGNNPAICERINTVWQAVETLNYDTNEYAFDLEKLKKRYEANELNKIKIALVKYAKSNEELADDPSTLNELVKATGRTVQQINIVRQGRSYTQKTVKEHISDFEESYNAQAKNGDSIDLIKTHYSGIDHATDGIAPAELIVIAGESNAGKSMLLNNMAIQMWMQDNTIYTPKHEMRRGYNVLYFSLEMPYEDCFARYMARLANVPQRSIAGRKLTSDEKQRVKQAEEFICNFSAEFEIVDVPRGLTIEEMELRYADALLKYRPHIVVIDYMGLMSEFRGSGEPDWLKLGELAGRLHEFARAYNIACLTAVQATDIKRGSKGGQKKTEDEVIGLHRVGRSSLIMHHANLGIQIEKRTGEEKYPDFKYHITKNRKGPLLKGSMLKNFANASLLDNGYVTPNTPTSSNNNIEDVKEDISAKIQKLIR